METVYHVPLLLREQGLLKLLTKGLDLDKLSVAPESIAKGDTLWKLWKKTVAIPKDFPTVEISLVGKYTQHMDSYLSTVKALEHAAMRCGRKLNLTNVDSEHLEEKMMEKDPAKYHKAWEVLSNSQGVSATLDYALLLWSTY